MNAIIGTIGHFVFERRAKGKTSTQLADSLEKSGQELAARFKSIPQTEANHRVITHIVGIEKWSQLRTAVVTGAPFRDEEYNGHRPPQNTAWSDLISLFETNRRETVALARRLSAAQLQQKVRHNMYGELPAAAWLVYIDAHSTLESRRLR